jgi:hypothetical protein
MHRDVGDGNPQPITVAEMMAELQLLAAQGHGNYKAGDDEESQEFAAQVRELNAGWTPGTIPRVPAGYRDARGPRLRQVAEQAQQRRRPVRSAPRRAATTSRRRPQSRQAARTVGGRGDPHLPDADDPEPEPLAVWRGLLAASVRMRVHLQRRAAAERTA